MAIRDGVSASIDAIPLTYNHKFFRLKIAIVPGEGGNVEDLLAADPHLSVSGFYTKAIYDFRSSFIPIIRKKMLLSRPEYGR